MTVGRLSPQRGYVCLIEEFGGRPAAGGSFSAPFVVGFFDSLDEMHRAVGPPAKSVLPHRANNPLPLVAGLCAKNKGSDG